MDWNAVTAICAIVTLIGLFGLFLMKSVIQSTFNDLMSAARKEFATNERVDGLEARFNDSRYQAPRRTSHGD